jgi:hypothetical protein
MAAWTGWESQLAKAAAIPDNAITKQFLDDWHTHADSNCARNPVDISHRIPGSRNCNKLTATKTAQNYQTRTGAAGAFTLQLESGSYPHLLNGLRTGEVFNQGLAADIHTDLVRWGSSNFAAWYKSTFVGPPPSGGSGGGGVKAPHSLQGWADLRRQINTTLPTRLRRIDHLNQDALRTLGRRRKVKG